MQDFTGLSGWIRMNQVLVDTSAKYDPGFDLPVGQYEPEKVRVLIVADGPISYFGRRRHEDFSPPTTEQLFSLGIVLEQAFDPQHPDHPSWVRFEFTKAHRAKAEGTTPGYENFRFKTGSLDRFDELWLFGYLGVSGEQSMLSSAEQRVVHAFMNDGGGVLAMGDHEDLGLGLCGNIARVRSMRKWWFLNPPPPPGMLKAPSITGAGQNRTLVGSGSDAEGDAAPQTIYPVYRYAHPSWDPWTNETYPHPILSGPRGVITVLPDHMHEGECIDADLSQFSGEYPFSVPPEIIANGFSTAQQPLRPFGLLSVWDGHDPRTGGRHGRVVVDSTWHHWFDMNLGGLAARYTRDYRDILCFFRNVAVWLASPGRQTQMRRSALVGAMLIPDMVELTATLRDYQPARFYEIGAAAKQALGRVAPQCQAAEWWRNWVVAETETPLRKLLYEPERDDRTADVMQAASIDLVTKTMAGAMFNALAIRINKAGFTALEKVVEKADDTAAEGAKLGRVAAAEVLMRAQGRLAPICGAVGKPKGAKEAPPVAASR